MNTRFNDQHAESFRALPPLILINGLAEQAETWYRNAPIWSQHFEVFQPKLASFRGAALHHRIEHRLPVDVPFLVDRLRSFLDEYVSDAPYRFVANSMGGKIMVEFALRYPEQVGRLALICPSGLASGERLPVMDGVRGRNMDAVIGTLFHDRSQADPKVIAHYQQSMRDKKWRTGWLRLIRGTMGHCVGDRIDQLKCPTLMVVGEEDRIVDPQDAISAAQRLEDCELVVVPGCGHAPQLERPDQVNQLIIDFMQKPAESKKRSPQLA